VSRWPILARMLKAMHAQEDRRSTGAKIRKVIVAKSTETSE